jgi:hypothetical protein
VTGPVPPAPAGMVWAVTADDDGWAITADGRVVETVRSHYDAWSVLDMAERYAGRSLLWRLDATGGFVSASLP